GYGLPEAVFVEFEDAPAVAEQEVGLDSGSEADDSAVSDAVASSSVDDLIRGWLAEEAVQSGDAPLVPDMEPDTAPTDAVEMLESDFAASETLVPGESAGLVSADAFFETMLEDASFTAAEAIGTGDIDIVLDEFALEAESGSERSE